MYLSNDQVRTFRQVFDASHLHLAAFARFAYRDEPPDTSATVARHEANLFDDRSVRQEQLVHLSAPGDKGRVSLLFGLCETVRFHQVVARVRCHQRRNVRRATCDGIRLQRQGQRHRDTEVLSIVSIMVSYVCRYVFLHHRSRVTCASSN
jgi:hypothetical protein